MGAITQAFHARMAGDAALTAMLSTYNGAPAIFTIEPVPGDARLPFIVAVGDVASSPFDTKTTRGRDITRDIRCYTEASGSMVGIEAIAERVRALFHRHRLAISGFGTLVAVASGPTIAPTDDTVYGMLVTVRLIIEEV